MSIDMSRRDFLKLLSLLPFAPLLSGASPPVAGATSAAASGKPNVLILVLDAFAAPNASVYGYPRRTTPNLERLAQRSIVYHRHNIRRKLGLRNKKVNLKTYLKSLE